MSFITWIGSKKRLLPQINQIIDEYPNREAIYVEPFLGSGIVLFNILEKYSDKFSRFICCDLNEALIISFNQIMTNHQNLIVTLKQIQDHYLTLDMNERKAFFYKARKIFNGIWLNRTVDKTELNDLISSDEYDLILAALFIFLNKTSFRGVFVVNSKNEYIASFGYSAHPNIVDPQLINKLHQLFTEHDVEFICCSYDELKLEDEMLLYLDSLYLETFDKYTSGGFSQELFVKYLEVVTNQEGCKIILSNSKEFETVIYQNAKINLPIINQITLREFQNGKTTTAKERVEILAMNII